MIAKYQCGFCGKETTREMETIPAPTTKCDHCTYWSAHVPDIRVAVEMVCRVLVTQSALDLHVLAASNSPKNITELHDYLYWLSQYSGYALRSIDLTPVLAYKKQQEQEQGR